MPEGSIQFNENVSFSPPSNSPPPNPPQESNSSFTPEFIAMMGEMGIHPMEQEDIMKNPVQNIETIQRIQEKLREKQNPEGESTQAVSIGGGGKNFEEQALHLDDILDAMIEYKASDLHMSVNSKIAMRVDGAIHFIDNVPMLNKEIGEKIILQLVDTEQKRETLKRTKELDCSYEHSDGTSFRVNIFYKRKNMSTVLRRIATKAFTLEQLSIPGSIQKLLQAKQGLILVTGPTGSGKSTSMQAMLNHINKTRVEHIVTIEDPIEFLFSNDKSIFSQREVGSDTLSFSNALKGAMRQDPDVVMIGEMRDPETIMAAMNLAETGHLVFSTLHTSGAPQTVSRIVNAFSPDEQSQVQSRLADSLIGVLSQRLVPRATGKGRCGIYEIMIINSAIRNIIRTGDLAQMDNAIQSGKKEGMIKMKAYADNLRDKSIILEKDYINFFKEE
jgi:twitching motility protein PilT